MAGAAILLIGWGAPANAGISMSGRGPVFGVGLTDDQINQLQTEQITFMKSTQGLHEQILEKSFIIKLEKMRKIPDTAKIISLKKEIADLKSQIKPYRKAHIAAMKKIDPDFIAGKGRAGRRMVPGAGATPAAGQN